MGAFGVIKANMNIPVTGLVIIGSGIIVLAFLFTVFQACRIKKIEAYNMLPAE